MIIIRVTIFILLISLTSCLDMFDKSPTKFMGNIYIRSSSNREDKFLVYGKTYAEDGFYRPIIDEPILAAYGDDSIIYVKSSFLNEMTYYLVKHCRGDTVLSIQKIDSLKYTNSLCGNKNIKQLH